MKQHAADFPFSRPQCDPIPILLRLLIVTVCLTPLVALAQTSAPASLPPAAQEALNKGIIAAKVPDYLLAMRFFEEARKIAPEAPVIYLNMGLAESRIPGRELRAMAWFGAYLAAYPDAPNAAAVKEQIAVLDVRNQSNVSRLITSMQDAANLIPDSGGKSAAQTWIAIAQLANGDIAGSKKTTDLMQVAQHKSNALVDIAEAQIRAGDLAGATNTLASAKRSADIIDTEPNIGFFSREGAKCLALARIASAQAEVGAIADALKAVAALKNETNVTSCKSDAQSYIAEVQARSGDIAGAKKTFAEAQKNAELIQEPGWKSPAQVKIAEAQARSGDVASAQKTFVEAQKNADLVNDPGWKSKLQKEIAEAQARGGTTNAPNSTRQSTSNNQPPIPPVITVSDWLKKLDDGNESNDCPLNTRLFLDLAGYLKALPPSGNPQTVFGSLREIPKTIVRAKNVITGMLKQQAMR